MLSNRDPFPQMRQNPFTDFFTLRRGSEIRQHQDKFVPALAGDGVNLAKVRFQNGRDMLQEGIPNAMAERVVDLLSIGKPRSTSATRCFPRVSSAAKDCLPESRSRARLDFCF